MFTRISKYQNGVRKKTTKLCITNNEKRLFDSNDKGNIRNEKTRKKIKRRTICISNKVSGGRDDDDGTRREKE